MGCYTHIITKKQSLSQTVLTKRVCEVITDVFADTYKKAYITEKE